MKRRSPFKLVTVASLGILTACGSTRMRSIHRRTDFRSADIQRVLVIGLFQDQALRKTFEEEFVRQWSARGVKASSSLAVLPATVPLTKAGVAPIAKAQGYDTVLAAKLLKRTPVPAGKLPARYIDPHPATNVENENNLVDVLFSPPVFISDYDLATVETNLYDVALERRIWSGTSETEIVGKIPKLIPPFVKVVLAHIYKPQ